MGTPQTRAQSEVKELRSARYQQPAAPRRDLAATLAAAGTPTHFGWYALPFFHRPHNVVANARATFRRASFDDRPFEIHLLYSSANGLSPWRTADSAAPRMGALQQAMRQLGHLQLLRAITRAVSLQADAQIFPQRRLAAKTPGRVQVGV